MARTLAAWHTRRDRAMVLLVTLGVLTILALLATTFVAISRMERSTSSNYVLETRAMMLAHSGVDMAVALFQTPAGSTPAALYGGEDWSGGREAIGTPDGNADDASGNRNGVLDLIACELRFARRPSFFAPDGAGLPRLVPVLGATGIAQRGYSGILPGTFHADGDTFVIGAVDTSAMAFVNGAGAGWRRLLDNLGQLVLGPGVPNLGTLIQARQPYSNIDELLSKSVIPLTQFDLLKPYLTAHAWEDPAVIRPDAQSSLLVRPENLRRLGWIEPRAPVNVNSADFLVLKATLLGISGYFTDNNTPTKSTYVLDAGRADNLARALVVAREETFTDANANKQFDSGESYLDLNANGKYDGPFRTWEQFEAFLPAVTGFVGNFNTWARDLVLANANPNTLTNKFNPDHHCWRGMDKADLIVATTEFCFEGTGFFRIRSLGRVTDTSFLTVAEKEIEVTVKLYEMARLTTQEDFEASLLKVSISPDVMTLPEEIAEILPESYADVNGDKRFTKGDTFTDGNADGMRDGPAIYDGQLRLRNADPPDSLPWGDSATQSFRCLITDSITEDALGPDKYPSFTADIATPGGAAGVPLSAGALRTTVDRGGSLLRDLNGANDYPDLFPDGMFIRREFGEAIYWTSLLNWPVGEGSYGFWVKPTWFNIPAAIEYRDFLTFNQQYSIAPNRGRISLMYALRSAPLPGVIVMESVWYHTSLGTAATAVANDAGFNPCPWMKTIYTLPWGSYWGPGQWHYFSARYTQQIKWSCFLDGVPFSVALEDPLPANTTVTLIGPAPTYNHMSIGSNMPWWDTLGSGTYDDFRGWISQVPNTNIGLTPPWRFDDTGYAGYSTYVGQFPLPAGARVRTVAWTEYRPTQNYRSDALSSTSSTPRRRRPDVNLSYRKSSEAGFRSSPALPTPDRFDGFSFTADPAMGTLAAGETLQYRFQWERRGQDPFRNSPTVDDITVTYTLGRVQFLTWQMLNN